MRFKMKFEEQKLITGNRDFDAWLNGGYEREIITCLYGPFASGKTNFCLMALSNILKQGKKGVYIDTEASFSVERLKQILGKDFLEGMLKNLIIIKPTSFQEQVEAFSKLLKLSAMENIALIIVDSIAMLYRLELGLIREEVKEEAKEIKASEERTAREEKERIRKINLMLATQLRLLSEIARKKSIPVIVTNQVYQSPIDNSTHMVGGDLLKYWSKCLIQLENLGDKKKAILIKHRSLGAREFLFKITERGIEKVRKFLF